MSDTKEDIIDIEGKENQNDYYDLVPDGEFRGLSFRVNDYRIDNDLLEIDYDIIDLPEGKEDAFENWLSIFVINSIERYIARVESGEVVINDDTPED